MEVVQLFEYEQIHQSFLRVKDTFRFLRNYPNLQEYIQKIAKSANVYVIFEEDECIAFAAVYMNDYDNRKAYISLFAVVDNYRKKGIGSYLLSFCEEQAHKKGMNFMILEVRKDNIPAQEFYKRAGYAFMQEETERAYLMQKSLTQLSE